ncbi:MAG: HAD-IIB family hydrolase [Bryobacterales bacterium]|nr:HAD-IIB family hydrolase [Bryobacterales bacterium]
MFHYPGAEVPGNGIAASRFHWTPGWSAAAALCGRGNLVGVLAVFTDLDGTLLDRDTYAFEAARPALDLLSRHGIPVVLCTSKTRAETEVWRRRLGNSAPFIVENGGAAFVPPGCFPFPVPGAVERGGYLAIEFGDPYLSLVSALKDASLACGVRVRGFHDMSPEEVAQRSGLSVEEARLARQREYGEPFLILDPTGEPALLAAIERSGKRWTRGGRFHHITGGNDKAGAVRILSDAFRRLHPDLTTVGLGDGLNDAGFLRVVDVAFLVRSPDSGALSVMVPRGRLTAGTGPEGWNEAILQLGVR